MIFSQKAVVFQFACQPQPGDPGAPEAIKTASRFLKTLGAISEGRATGFGV
jgi:hypothetical protein